MLTYIKLINKFNNFRGSVSLNFGIIAGVLCWPAVRQRVTGSERYEPCTVCSVHSY